MATPLRHLTQNPARKRPRRQKAEDFVCSDCAELELSGYMVENSVWREAGAHRFELLHLECLEKRLGRPLTIEDFTPAPINHSIRWALRRAK